MRGLDEAPTVVVHGADEHPEREDVATGSGKLCRLELNFWCHVIQVWLSHLWLFRGARIDAVGVLEKMVFVCAFVCVCVCVCVCEFVCV